MKSLRQHCRLARRSLSKQQQIQHAKQAAKLLLRQPCLQRKKRIAVFLAQDGELDTQFLTQALWQRGHQVFLPVLKTLRGRHMAFAPYHASTQFQANQFGILEPKESHHNHLTGNQLDVVIMPLTCFDEQGNRIGMGGGFYDRTFAFKRIQQHNRPKLIGWAHECQKVSKIPTEKWDVPLDGLISEKQAYFF